MVVANCLKCKSSMQQCMVGEVGMLDDGGLHLGRMNCMECLKIERG